MLMRKVSDNKKTKRMAGVLAKAVAGTTAGMMTMAMVLAAVPVNAAADEVIMEWREENGVKYWYENGVRQGVKYNADGSIDISYRGKEIYDPSSAAWYWLDCVQNGAVAKNKDVYQESAAGQWGASTNENGEKVGKWVRYDENGHMVKGWQTTEAGTYYFDTVYGTMAKGLADIDGSRYYFKVTTGAAEKDTVMDLDGHSYVFDAEGRGSILKSLTYMNRYANGDIKAWYESTYDENGNELRYTEYNEDGTISWYDEMEYDANNNQLSMKTYYKEGVVSKAKYYEYDANNNMVKSILCDSNNEVTGTNWMSYDDRNNLISVIHCDGDSATAVSWREEYEYDDNGNKIKMSYYYGHAEKPGWWDIYEYDANNTLRKESRYKYSGLIQSTEYDERGNKTGDNIKNIYYDETNTREALFYRDGEVSRIELYRYNDNGDEILCQYLTGDRQKITFWRAMEYNEYNYPVKKTYYNGNVDNIKYYIDYIYR